MTDDQIIIFQSTDGTTTVDVKLEKATVWLTLNQLADVFQRDKSVISRHLNNIYNEGELDRGATVAKNATVQIEGKRKVDRDIEHLKPWLNWRLNWVLFLFISPRNLLMLNGLIEFKLLIAQ